MAQRAADVKAAHAHLVKTVPGFSQKPMAEQMKAHQAHIRKTKGY